MTNIYLAIDILSFKKKLNLEQGAVDCDDKEAESCTNGLLFRLICE